jgi:thiol-disulfide isomerase/thioredoxin
MTIGPQEPRFPLRGRRRIIFGVGLAAGLVVLAVYGMTALTRNAPEPGCAAAVELAQRIAPLAHGELAAFAVAERGLAVPDLGFRDVNGGERRLSQWRGRTVLLNLWATWCVPCRKEMPALNALEEKLGGARFEVVAVNIDTRDPDKSRVWLRDAGVDRLAYYADSSGRIFQDLKAIGRAIGMPTTLLIDPSGCEIGTIAGPAEWASPDGVALISAALGKASL